MTGEFADRWQEGWDKMEEAVRRERDIGELDRQDREDKGLAHLEERRRREPPIGEPCETCNGAGCVIVTTGPCPDCGFEQQECPRCQGTGVW